MNNSLIFTGAEQEQEQLHRYRKRVTVAKAVVCLFASILIVAAIKDSFAETAHCSTPVAITIATSIVYVLLAITCIRNPAISLMVAAATTAFFALSALMTLLTMAPKESTGGVLLFLAITVVAFIILASGVAAARKLNKAQP